MRKKHGRFFALICGIVSVLLMYAIYVLLQYYHVGIIKQLTPSMPEGYYLTYYTNKIERKDDVVFWPNQKTQDLIVKRKWLAKGVPLLKQVVGVPGDQLCIKDHKVYLNTKEIAKIERFDDQHRMLPVFRYCGIIPKAHYFMQGISNPKSFDSRYYGLISKAQITAKAVKL